LRKEKTGYYACLNSNVETLNGHSIRIGLQLTYVTRVSRFRKTRKRGFAAFGAA
jgi:hypothetical protein